MTSSAAHSQAALRAFELARSGRPEQALSVARAATQRDPRDHGVAYVLGCLLRDAGQDVQALYHLERAARLRPGEAEYVYAVGTVLQNLDRVQGALDAYARVVELNPGRVLARVRAADLLIETGRAEEALAAAGRTAELFPDQPEFMSIAAGFSNYASSVSATERLDLHRRAAAGHAAIADALPAPPTRAVDRSPERPLRVAYLSPDLYSHAVTQFLEPVWAHRDRAAHKVYGYFARPRADATTARLKAMADGWRDLPEPTMEQVWRLLVEDGIDIAIDLAGYTTATLLWTLARRVVPVQATYLGYPNTTGLSTVDWRIVDGVSDPSPGADALATERLLRLDPCFLCLNAGGEWPDVSAPPSAGGAPIVFGSFNILPKVSALTRSLWSRVLQAVPRSRLLIKDKGLEHEGKRGPVLEVLRASGIDPSRVTLMGKTPTRREHLELYGRVDVCLDTTPYAGTTTTGEALMMGVPVVTLAGESHVERVGASMLRCVGLGELVAESVDEYVRIATSLPTDSARLAALRAGMRARVVGSPLCDGPAFAARFDAGLRAMWADSCRRGA